MTFKKWSCKLKKMIKNDKKMWFKNLKNDKVEHVLLYHFLNDENRTQILSPGKKRLIQPHVPKHERMEVAFALLIFAYIRRKKTWINFFKLFDY